MGDCPCLNKVVVALMLRARLLAYKREVNIEVFRIKVYSKKVLRWLREELKLL